MAQDNGGSAVFVSFVLGAVVGAAAAVLLAPMAGDETRRIIREKADEARHRANDAARQGREFIERQRDSLSTAIEHGKEAYYRARGSEPGQTTESEA
jgi:gas vesicle protein